MESIKNNGPMSSVKGAKISGGKVNTWAEVADLGVTDTTVNTTERIRRTYLGAVRSFCNWGKQYKSIEKAKWNGLLHRRS